MAQKLIGKYVLDTRDLPNPPEMIGTWVERALEGLVKAGDVNWSTLTIEIGPTKVNPPPYLVIFVQVEAEPKGA